MKYLILPLFLLLVACGGPNLAEQKGLEEGQTVMVGHRRGIITHVYGSGEAVWVLLDGAEDSRPFKVSAVNRHYGPVEEEGDDL